MCTKARHRGARQPTADCRAHLVRAWSDATVLTHHMWESALAAVYSLGLCSGAACSLPSSLICFSNMVLACCITSSFEHLNVELCCSCARGSMLAAPCRWQLSAAC